MAFYERNAGSPQFNRTDGRFTTPENSQDVPVGDLLRRIGQDASTLVRNEIALAKLEMRESVKSYVKPAVRLGIAAGAGLVGAFALTAFLIIALGDALDNYWLSALIVTVVLLVTAAVLAKGAMETLKHNSLAPRETVQTLKEDKQWASHEARDFKQSLKA